MTKKIVALLICALMLICFVSCSDKERYEKITSDYTNYVEFEMDDGEKFVMELYPEIAPVSVKNFQELVAKGFYDGLKFHRIMTGYFIQCGDPTGTGFSNSGKSIFGEFSDNGYDNKLSHTRGVVSMGRLSNNYNSGSSHFFICTQDLSKWFDGHYAAFGKVISGMETVDKICATKTDENDTPYVDHYIKTARFIEGE